MTATVRPWILLPPDGDEAERELRAQLHAERIVVSRLRDEAQRLVGHVQSLKSAVAGRARSSFVIRGRVASLQNGGGIHAAEYFGAQGEEQL